MVTTYLTDERDMVPMDAFRQFHILPPFTWALKLSLQRHWLMFEKDFLSSWNGRFTEQETFWANPLFHFQDYTQSKTVHPVGGISRGKVPPQSSLKLRESICLVWKDPNLAATRSWCKQRRSSGRQRVLKQSRQSLFYWWCSRDRPPHTPSASLFHHFK